MHSVQVLAFQIVILKVNNFILTYIVVAQHPFHVQKNDFAIRFHVASKLQVTGIDLSQIAADPSL